MDAIRITGLEVWAHHGVLVEEKQRGQRFVLDVTLDVDLAPAGRSDDLADTIDYGTLANRIHAVATAGSHDLIETVASNVLDVCLDDPRVASAEVTVHKPSVPLEVPAAEVSVTLRRDRGA